MGSLRRTVKGASRRSPRETPRIDTKSWFGFPFTHHLEGGHNPSSFRFFPERFASLKPKKTGHFVAFRIAHGFFSKSLWFVVGSPVDTPRPDFVDGERYRSPCCRIGFDRPESNISLARRMPACYYYYYSCCHHDHPRPERAMRCRAMPCDAV